MAPAKKSAAATVPEEQGPTLKLIVEKGPIAGQIFEFKPGAQIHIGRVVRGNTITIKDAGVSSKHVLIGFVSDVHPDPASSSCSWTVTDLDSSNGTIVNVSELQPHKPSVLYDGDVVKIGEMTSIRVKFKVTEHEREGDAGKVRRNPRRGVAGRGQTAVELVEIDQYSDLGAAIEDKNDLKGRTRNGEDVGSRHEGGELGKNNEGKGGGRRTLRSKSNTESRCEQMENVEKMNSKALVKGQEECMEEVVYVGEVKGKGGRRGRGRPRVSTRGTRSSKEEEKLENLDQTRVDDLSLMKAEQRASARMTRSSRNKGNVDMELDMGVTMGRRMRKGTRGKNNLAVENHEEEKVVEELNSENEICKGDNKKFEGANGVVKEKLGREQQEMFEGGKGKLEEEGVNGVVTEISGRERHEICEGDKGKLEDGVDGEATANSGREKHEMCEGDKGELEEDGVNDVMKESSGREGAAGLASTSGMKESSVEVVDLEKMTLGEWFDYLEVYLPKQIIDETEELISDMRHKAEKLQEFMLQQKNAKEEDGLSPAV